MPNTCYRPTTEDALRYLSLLSGGEAGRGRLVSLLYLADRVSIIQHGHSITEDRYICVDGTVRGVGTSRVAAVMTGRGLLKLPLPSGAFMHLSRADHRILTSIHLEFQDMNDQALQAHLKSKSFHPETEEDGLISHLALATHLGVNDPKGVADHLDESRSLRWCFSDIKLKDASPQATVNSI